MATETLPRDVEVGDTPRQTTGWVERFISLPDRLPGAAILWLFVLYAVLVILAHAPLWISGSASGGFEPFLVVPALFITYFVALGYLLRRVAAAAFESFRPALGDPLDRNDSLAFELVRIPDRNALAATVFAFVIIGIGFLLEPPSGYPEPISPLAEATSWLIWWLAIAAGAVAIAVIVRQLRQVSRLYRMATNVDIFDTRPINALSKLTATAALGILLVAFFFIVPEDDAYVPLATGVGLISLAALTFVLPLRGMHERLVMEKIRLLSESDSRLKQTLAWIHQSVDVKDLADADQLNRTLTSLLAERDVLAKLSTWPWSSGTIRGFVTAAVLPVLLWLIIRALERFV